MIAALQQRYQSFFATAPAIPFAVAAPDGEPHRSAPANRRSRSPVKDARGAKALAGARPVRRRRRVPRGWLDVDGDLAAALKMRDFFHDIHPIAWVSQFVPP